MAHDPTRPIRILADRATGQRIAGQLTRRGFLGVTGLGAASLAFLAACGGSSDDDGGSGSGATTTAGGGGGGSTAPAGSVPTSIDPDATSFNLYTWAEYDDPDLMQSFGNITIDIYNSNEEAIAKLQASSGTAGYDMVVPTGAYVPQMAELGLIAELNLDLLPGFQNVAEVYRGQAWDPENRYSVPKAWGTTGWIYDNTVITEPIETWSDFIAAAQGVASGQVSVLDSPPNLTGIYFWANDIPWTTEEPADLDACEAFTVNDLAPHIKAFDSYPGINLTSGNYVLSQVWNGDARQGLIAVGESDAGNYTWGLGAPVTELWMDNWCVVNGAPNVDAAYNFINFILEPENSVIEVEYHGYHTAIAGIEELVPADTPYKDMIFFTDEQVNTMQAGEVNSAQQRLVDIYNKAKAAAGG
jgi:spermidine/putrescine transport system substrate-binding protein